MVTVYNAEGYVLGTARLPFFAEIRIAYAGKENDYETEDES